MENQVTLDRSEYDRLKDSERELKTLNQTLQDNEPLIISVHDRWGNENNMRAISGKEQVEDFFKEYNQLNEQLREEVKIIEEKYEKQNDLLQLIKAYFN